jgi:hypothetical protein
MIWYRPAVVLVALLVSGCGSGSAAHTVHVHGTLVRVGGPAPGAPVALGGVDVRFRDAGESAAVHTDRHGRFAFDVRPGTYRVTITAGGPQANGRPIQPVPRVVHVPHTGRLRLVINIK